MRIGELANASGLSRETLRFYERSGLLRARRRPNGYRDYPAETLPLLRLMRQAQALGFSLAEIRAALQQDGDAGQVAAMLNEKLAATDARLAELQALRSELAALAGRPCPLRAADCPG